MKHTKEQIINYMVDVMGYTEEEARHQISVYGQACFTDDQWVECKKFNS